MIYLATPIWRYYDVRAAHALNAAIAMNRTEEAVWWETLDGDALIARSRSKLCTKFFEGVYHPITGERADVMVILDDDVQFAPDDLWKIVKLAREKKEPAGGIYVTRSREPHTAAMLFSGQPMTWGPDEPPVPIRYLATGFMAVPLSCVEAVKDKGEREGFDNGIGEMEMMRYCELGVGDAPMWDFFSTFNLREPDGRWHYLSEDWAFCERLRQCGYNIWADPSIILSHRAYVSITVHDLPGASNGRNMLTADGAPASGASILIVDPNEQEERTIGSVQEEHAAVTA